MKLLSSPLFWFTFGIVGYPVLCLSFALMIFGLSPSDRWMLELWALTFDPQCSLGIYLGIPLTMVSALCAMFWRNRRFTAARRVAFLGGVLIAVLWLLWFNNIQPIGWVETFAFAAPPLTWSACLLLFAVYARTPKRIYETHQ